MLSVAWFFRYLPLRKTMHEPMRETEQPFNAPHRDTGVARHFPVIANHVDITPEAGILEDDDGDD